MYQSSHPLKTQKVYKNNSINCMNLCKHTCCLCDVLCECVSVCIDNSIDNQFPITRTGGMSSVMAVP